MSNSFWNFTGSTDLAAGSLAKASEVNTLFSGVSSGLDLIEAELNKSIQITDVGGGTFDISDSAAVRADKVVGFDGAGDITILTNSGANLPTSLAGDTLQFLRVNSGETGYEHVAIWPTTLGTTQAGRAWTSSASDTTIVNSTVGFQAAVICVSTASFGARVAVSYSWPALVFDDTSHTTGDRSRWRIIGDSGGQTLKFDLLSDDELSSTNIITVGRTGMTLDYVDILADNVTLQGSAGAELVFYESGLGTDLGKWDIRADSGYFNMHLVSDDELTRVPFIGVARTGTGASMECTSFTIRSNNTHFLLPDGTTDAYFSMGGSVVGGTTILTCLADTSRTISFPNQAGNLAIFDAEFDAGTATASMPIDWTDSTTQKVTIGASAVTSVAFTDPTGPCILTLKIVQHATTPQTVTGWDATILWAGGSAPTITASAGAVDIIRLYFDGTSYYPLSVTQNHS